MKRSSLVAAISAAGLMLALLVTPARGAASASNNTLTTSTSSSQASHDTRVNLNLTSTRVLGLASWSGHGSIPGYLNKNVYDLTMASPIGSPQVTQAYAEARAAVQHDLESSTGGRRPLDIASGTQLGTSTQTNTVENSRTSTQIVTLEETIGPGTILIGDRDQGGTPFLVLVGTQNLNANTETHTDIYTTTTASTTIAATYTVSGECLR